MRKPEYIQLHTYSQDLLFRYGVDYAKVSIETLLDGFCDATDAHDERKRNAFAAGLLLRKWNAWVRYKDTSPSHGKDLAYFVFDWGWKAIELACQYRGWRTKNITGEQALNQCITTVRLRELYDSSLDKKKANYNAASLDDFIDEEGATFVDNLPDEQNKSDGERRAREIIQVCVDRKKLVEAIILDTMAFNDVEKEVKEKIMITDEYGDQVEKTIKRKEFWPYRCAQLLEGLPKDYDNYFIKNYDVNEHEIKVAIEALRKLNRTKLYKSIDNTRATAKRLLADCF